MLKRLLCCLLSLVAIGVGICHAQTHIPTTQGTHFWVSYMRNGYRNGNSDHLYLIASAKEGCEVTVSNPHSDYARSFSVASQGANILEMDTLHCYNSQKGGSAFKGLLVESTDTISLYVANEAENSYDAANVLPIEALGVQYMIQSNKSIGEQSNHMNENRASFMVIATEDGTRVEIIPTCLTYDDHEAGTPYYIDLDMGECYHVINKETGAENNDHGDFSGTRVRSVDGKPIAVFNGNCITSIPGNTTSGFDHVFEQAMPVDHWGKQFVVTKTKGVESQQYDRIKITASSENTIVQRDGDELCSLDAGESYSFWLTGDCCYLESNNPVAVFLYNHSHSESTTNPKGDPSMVWISPVEQNLQEVVFSTFSSGSTNLNHYVNAVCYTENVSDLLLNNGTIPSNSIKTVPGAPQFSYVSLEVRNGVNILKCPGGLVAHVYGVGVRQGYAYTVGSSARKLSMQLFVDDILSTELPDGYNVCQGNAQIQFRTSFNYEYDHLSWDFGDGTLIEGGEEMTHDYAGDGDFEVNTVVFRESDGLVRPFDSLQVMIHVAPRVNVWVEQTTCYDYYLFHGTYYPVPVHEDVIISNEMSCDTIFHLDIIQGQTVSAEPRYDTICEGDEGVMWFGTLLDATGVYPVVVEYEDACDSLFVLDLTVEKIPDHTERWVQSCDVFQWHDLVCSTTDDYTLPFTTSAGCEYDSVLHFTLLPSGDSSLEIETCDSFDWMGDTYDELGTHEYTKTIIGNNGCESIVTLTLTLYPSPLFEEILGMSQVAVATNFWPGEYNYYLDDSTQVDLSRIEWELLDNPQGPGQWALKPHGASCTIIAYSRGDRRLRVSTGSSMCDKEITKTIHCSSYDVDESETVQLEVYPNPARNEVMVKGLEMEEVSVYNLMGQKVRTVAAQQASEVSIRVDDLPQALYLLEVRTPRGNKTSLVSVIK